MSRAAPSINSFIHNRHKFYNSSQSHKSNSNCVTVTALWFSNSLTFTPNVEINPIAHLQQPYSHC